MNNDQKLLENGNGEKGINELYKSLSVRADTVYDFVISYYEYIYSSHNYGTDYNFTMMEIHTLTHIDDNPSVTITELAKIWSKTKSAVSQTVKILVEKGYVERRAKSNNNKTILLYATEEGRRVSLIHKAYDIADITQTTNHLINKCGNEDVSAFFRVLACYVELLKD